MNIAGLSNMMNVSKIDLNCLLVGIVNDLKKDRITEHFINGSDEQRNEILKAYIHEQIKKTKELFAELKCSDDRKQAFQNVVYELLKNA